MTKCEQLGDRMKRYEASSDTRLMRKIPVVLRLDMCAGHTFTKRMAKPFDTIFMWCMVETMYNLCKDIQGCVFGYTQSDEISLILQDYAKQETDAWFDYRVEKLCSVAASKAAKYFNRIFTQTIEDIKTNDMQLPEYLEVFNDKDYMPGLPYSASAFMSVYEQKQFEAEFDCRAFNVPFGDIVEYVQWRQMDAERNSVQAVAQALYSHKEISGISNNQLQNKMLTERDINWNNFATPKKRGTSCYKLVTAVEDGLPAWYVDYDMPIIKEDKSYVADVVSLGVSHCFN